MKKAAWIRSAEQQHQERSKNRQSGWNAGVALAFNNGVSLGFTAGGNYGKGGTKSGATGKGSTSAKGSGQPESSPSQGGTAGEKFDKAVGNVAEKVGQGNAVYDQTFGKRDRLGRLHDQKTGRYLTDPNRLDTDLVRSS